MLTQLQIDEIVQRIANNYILQKIILFGSYAYGEPSENSDLDLLVIVKDSEQPRYKRAREIRKQLWGISDVPKDIIVYTEDEVKDWKNVDAAFITKIIKQGRVLYENKGRVGKSLD